MSEFDGLWKQVILQQNLQAVFCSLEGDYLTEHKEKEPSMH